MFIGIIKSKALFSLPKAWLDKQGSPVAHYCIHSTFILYFAVMHHISHVWYVYITYHMYDMYISHITCMICIYHISHVWYVYITYHFIENGDIPHPTCQTMEGTCPLFSLDFEPSCAICASVLGLWIDWTLIWYQALSMTPAPVTVNTCRWAGRKNAGDIFLSFQNLHR